MELKFIYDLEGLLLQTKAKTLFELYNLGYDVEGFLLRRQRELSNELVYISTCLDALHQHKAQNGLPNQLQGSMPNSMDSSISQVNHGQMFSPQPPMQQPPAPMPPQPMQQNMQPPHMQHPQPMEMGPAEPPQVMPQMSQQIEQQPPMQGLQAPQGTQGYAQGPVPIPEHGSHMQVQFNAPPAYAVNNQEPSSEQPNYEPIPPHFQNQQPNQINPAQIQSTPLPANQIQPQQPFGGEQVGAAMGAFGAAVMGTLMSPVMAQSPADDEANAAQLSFLTESDNEEEFDIHDDEFNSYHVKDEAEAYEEQYGSEDIVKSDEPAAANEAESASTSNATAAPQEDAASDDGVEDLTTPYGTKPLDSYKTEPDEDDDFDLEEAAEDYKWARSRFREYEEYNDDFNYTDPSRDDYIGT